MVIWIIEPSTHIPLATSLLAIQLYTSSWSTQNWNTLSCHFGTETWCWNLSVDYSYARDWILVYNRATGHTNFDYLGYLCAWSIFKFIHVACVVDLEPLKASKPGNTRNNEKGGCNIAHQVDTINQSKLSNGMSICWTITWILYNVFA